MTARCKSVVAAFWSPNNSVVSREKATFRKIRLTDLSGVLSICVTLNWSVEVLCGMSLQLNRSFHKIYDQNTDRNIYASYLPIDYRRIIMSNSRSLEFCHRSDSISNEFQMKPQDSWIGMKFSKMIKKKFWGWNLIIFFSSNLARKMRQTGKIVFLTPSGG